MKLLVNLLLLSSFSLLVSCSNSEQVVSNSLIQKRKYRKGFHIKKLQNQHRINQDNSTALQSDLESNAKKPKAEKEQLKENKAIARVEIESQSPEKLAHQKPPKVLSAPLASLELISNQKLFLEDSENLAGRLAGNYFRKLKKEVDETKEIKRWGSMSLFAYFLGILLGVLGIVSLILGFFQAIGTGETIFLFSGIILITIGGLLTLASLGLAIASVVQYAQNENKQTKRQMIFGIITLALLFLAVIGPYILPLFAFAW